jgi:hypothetical protein
VTLRAHNDRDYRAYRNWLKANNVPCWYGCGNKATSPDHRPRLSEHTHVRGSGCCQLLPACRSCNSSDGASEGNRRRGNWWTA